jgi:hypothetical protein
MKLKKLKEEVPKYEGKQHSKQPKKVAKKTKPYRNT